jgi:superfamily I DNA/RNA helicase
MIVSFTKVAAREIATKKSMITGQTIDVNPKNVGTLHQICYHALDQPKIAETITDRFNEQYDPVYVLSTSKVKSMSAENTFLENSSGSGADALLQKLNIYRNKITPREVWDPQVEEFEKCWAKFKEEQGCLDFTDLIETAIDELPYAPNHPDVIFVDEAQDTTALQLKLIRSWAMNIEWLMLVGDDDQAIFRFAGASAETFLDDIISSKNKKILSQSYRVPKAVLECANRLIDNVSRRQEKVYAPRKDYFSEDYAIGNVSKSMGTYNKPALLIEIAKERFKNDRSVMFLTSCSYMLSKIRTELKIASLPFGNKYRKERGDWNPLRIGATGVSSAQLISAFVGNGIDDVWWNVPQFISWAKFIKVSETGLIHKRGKAGLRALEEAVENNNPGLHTTRNVAPQILTPVALQYALKRDTDWLHSNLVMSRSRTIDYPLKVFNEFGIDAIESIPIITIGTIHSVKGGEADTVIVFPDISYKASAEKNASTENKDALYRLFYVAMTRAREELIIASPVNPRLHMEFKLRE